MRVPVNAHTIIEYNLTQISGYSDEELLKMRDEMLAEGTILTCEIPEPGQTRNVFDFYDPEAAVEPEVSHHTDVETPLSREPRPAHHTIVVVQVDPETGEPVEQGD